MNHRALDAILENLPKHYIKEQVMAYYPRRIITPLEYLNPKYFSLINFMFINYTEPYVNLPQLLKRRYARLFFSQVLVEKYVPTYFLDEAFLEAVDQTEMLESFTFAQLHFPMQGFLLVLPCDWIKSKVGVHIPFVMVSTRDGFLHISQDVVGDDGRLRFVACNLLYENIGETIAAAIKFKKNLAFTQEEAFAIEAIADNSCDTNSGEVAIYVFELVMKLLIILSTQPNAFVDTIDDQPARKHRERKNGTIKTDALWNPCFIGKRHSTQRIGTVDGIGPGKRMHWRRGHLRNQRCGEGWLILKPVWIKPALIHREMLELE